MSLLAKFTPCCATGPLLKSRQARVTYRFPVNYLVLYQ